jgi:paraquat-inducible protein B
VTGRTHPRLIGAFVLGAVALVLAALVLLGSGDWFVHRDRFAVYFPGSVKGLNRGAAVTFRGIKVGEVVDVQAFLTGLEDPLIQIETVIEISTAAIETPPGVKRAFAENASPQEFSQWLIKRGVRARMMSGSLVTGQRYVDLDFLPKDPARFIALHPRYPELPTTPTPMEKMGDRADELFAKLAELPLAEMLDDVRKAIAAARTVLESKDLQQVFVSTNRTARTLEARLVDLHETLATADKALGTVDRQAGLAGEDARKTLEGLRDTLARTQKSLDAVEGTLRGTDETRVTASQALLELSRTMQALRNLVDYIQTHPEAIVLGKEQAKEKK